MIFAKNVNAFEEQGVFAMEDGLLERPLHQVGVERCTGLAQEEGEGIPAAVHVSDGLAESGVGLDVALGDLPSSPCVERP